MNQPDHYCYVCQRTEPCYDRTCFEEEVLCVECREKVDREEEAYLDAPYDNPSAKWGTGQGFYPKGAR
jgi:hypothetical protein